jgi:RNA polymerase sigma-70 factor, ECF subfamily
MQAIHDDLVAQLPHLRAFARSLTRGNPHLADDLVQDTVMLALRSWDKFTPGTNFAAWLLKILHNRFYSLTRRKHVTAEIGNEGLLDRQATPAAQESGLEVQAFKAAFAGLSSAHREALVLAGVHGLSYEEVASICGCEVGTVKSRISRARALLKRRLLGEDVPGGEPARRGPFGRRQRVRDVAALLEPADETLEHI